MCCGMHMRMCMCMFSVWPEDMCATWDFIVLATTKSEPHCNVGVIRHISLPYKK